MNYPLVEATWGTGFQLNSYSTATCSVGVSLVTVLKDYGNCPYARRVPLILGTMALVVVSPLSLYFW